MWLQCALLGFSRVLLGASVRCHRPSTGFLADKSEYCPVALSFDSDEPTRTAEVFLNRNGVMSETISRQSGSRLPIKDWLPETLANHHAYLDEPAGCSVPLIRCRSSPTTWRSGCCSRRARAQGVLRFP